MKRQITVWPESDSTWIVSRDDEASDTLAVFDDEAERDGDHAPRMPRREGDWRTECSNFVTVIHSILFRLAQTERRGEGCHRSRKLGSSQRSTTNSGESWSWTARNGSGFWTW